MPGSALLFRELGQLAHHAAMGMATISGNGAVAASANQAMLHAQEIEIGHARDLIKTGIADTQGARNGRQKLNAIRNMTHYDWQFKRPGLNQTLHIATRDGGYIFFQNDDGFETAYADRAGSQSDPLTYPEPNAPRFKVNQPDETPPDELTGERSSEEPKIVRGGGLTLTGSYSSIEGFSVGGKIARTNIAGLNTELAATAHYSKIRSLFEVGYTDGNLLGSNTTVAPTIFDSQLSATGFGDGIGKTPFSQSARGINVMMHKKFKNGLSSTLNYRISDDIFRPRGKNVHCDIATFGSVLCAEIGPRTTSILTVALSFDEKLQINGRNHRFRMRLTHDLSAGGTAKFSRTRFSSEAHINLSSRLSFSLEAEGGFMTPIGNDRLPLFERFYVGNSSMRGFDLRGIGPKIRPANSTSAQNIAIGGTAYYVVRTDLALSLHKVSSRFALQPSVFIDAGSVFLARDKLLLGETLIGNSAKPRVSVGVGLGMPTPAGKFRIDFVRPILKQTGDRPKTLSISFGTAM